jgi:sterol desaturase/sphingolipid hydroxylase (fatty acid hydroxylase superfamily)
MTPFASLAATQSAGELTWLTVAFATAATTLFLVFRSAIVLGLAFAWIRFSAFAKRRRILRLPYANGQIWSELKAAVPVVALDAVVVVAVVSAGLLPLGETTWRTALLTFGLMFAWFELWFYATHRLLHTPRFYWIHRQHHTAKVVDPLTSLSFSLIERLILLAGAVGFAIMLARIIPLSAAGLMAYGLTNYVLNVLGHSNVEIFPRWFTRSWIGRLVITPTYHALHHARYRGHYGLFTSILDRAFGSIFPDYEHVQERASAGNGLTRQGERVEPEPTGAPGGSRPGEGRRLIIVLAVAIATIAGLSIVSARADIMTDCRGDYLRLCAGVLPGDGRIARCLVGRRAQLSPACGASLSAVALCRPEIERHCRSSSSPAELKSCLESRRGELSGDCRRSLGGF